MRRAYWSTRRCLLACGPRNLPDRSSPDEHSPRDMSPGELQKFFASEAERWGPLAKGLSASAK